MPKINLTDVGSLGNPSSARQNINANFDAIEAAFDEMLDRKGRDPNQMEADLDMDSHRVLNLADPLADGDAVNRRSIKPLVDAYASQIVVDTVFGTVVVDPFIASAAQTDFPLTSSPGEAKNLEVFVDGSALRPVLDYVLVGADLKMLRLIVPATAGQKVMARYAKALASQVAEASAVAYTSPEGSTVKDFLDGVQSPDGSDRVGFLQAGTGAVARTALSKMRDGLHATDFGVTADGVTDDTAAMANALARAKATAKPLHLPKGTIKTTAPLDISGCTLIGVAQGYRNSDGTIIQGSGSHDVLVQVNATAADTSINLYNLRIKGAQWGIKVRYMLHSHWANVHVTDSQNGIQFGNSSDAGGLFDTFDNIEVDVVNTGIEINGNGFVNANSFNQCFFKGGQYGGTLNCVGGIGASDNVFNCTEFLGDRYGIRLDNTSNTTFNQCYFESLGPSVLLSTNNTGWNLNNCVYAVLTNNNTTGRTAFIYHQSGGTQKGSINGGFIYLDASAVHNNLSFVASEAPANFVLFMADAPELAVAASGFVLLNGLTSTNLQINESRSYTPVWGSTATAPSLGNGTITGSLTRSGNVCTVTITLTAGSTTTFGTGDWTFSLPYPSVAATAGSAYILDAGTGYFDAISLVGSGSSLVSLYRNGTASLVGATVPMTWAVNDSLTISFSYRC